VISDGARGRFTFETLAFRVSYEVVFAPQETRCDADNFVYRITTTDLESQIAEKYF